MAKIRVKLVDAGSIFYEAHQGATVLGTKVVEVNLSAKVAKAIKDGRLVEVKGPSKSEKEVELKAKQAEEEAKLKAEQEEKSKAEEEAKKAEQEAKAKEEQEAKLKAEEDSKAKQPEKGK